MNFAAKIPRAFISALVMKPLAHMTLRTLVPHHLPLSLYHVTVGQLITCSLLITDMGQIPISNGHYKCHSYTQQTLYTLLVTSTSRCSSTDLLTTSCYETICFLGNPLNISVYVLSSLSSRSSYNMIIILLLLIIYNCKVSSILARKLSQLNGDPFLILDNIFHLSCKTSSKKDCLLFYKCSSQNLYWIFYKF